MEESTDRYCDWRASVRASNDPSILSGAAAAAAAAVAAVVVALVFLVSGARERVRACAA